VDGRVSAHERGLARSREAETWELAPSALGTHVVDEMATNTSETRRSIASAGHPTRSRWRLRTNRLHTLVAVVVGVAAVAVQYHVELTAGFDLFPGAPGDTRLIAYLCEHWYQSLLGHESLLSPPMFYPLKETLGYSDVLVAFIPLYAVGRVCGLGVFSALELVVVVFSFLNYACCYWLLKRVLALGLLASLVGSLLFAFSGPLLAQPEHVQLYALFLLPLAAGLVLNFALRSEAMSPMSAFLLLAGAGLIVDLELLTSFYLGWFFIAWSAVFVLFALALPRTRAFVVGLVRRHSRPLLGAAVVFAVGLVPFARIYWPVVRTVGWQPYATALAYLPEPKSYLLMADDNVVWRGVTHALVSPANPDWGRRVGIGLVASVAWIVLSVLAVVRLKRERRSAGEGSGALGPLVAAMAVLAVDAFVLATLQIHGHSPWRAVWEVVPGARGIRAVARVLIVLALPISVVLAVALDRLWARASRFERRTRNLFYAVVASIAAFAVVEQLSWRAHGHSFSIAAQAVTVHRLAAKLPAGCTAFYVQPAPGHHRQSTEEYQQDAMLVSQERHVPTLNGRSGKYPVQLGWGLFDTFAADYEQQVARWIALRHVRGRVCRLED
jgi:hypothetical protein